uniref:Cyclin-like domain-containing protein n=1 Tax=Ditylenchus dipsaci TaxID=166011 RepID=A0A915D722_9BILA
MSVGNHWLFTIKQLEETPTRKYGIPQQDEDKLRKEGEIGSLLKLNTNPTLATASVFFHRFYMFHSFTEFPKQITALACLFLAGKVEETPKKCKDIVATAKESFPSDFISKNLTDEVMSLERVLLQTARFDLHVEHPYNFLLQYAKPFKMEKSEMAKIVQDAWTFMNDSAYTTLCLQWEPEVIAISLLYMSFKKTGVEPDWRDKNPDEQWWEAYVANLTTEMMQEVCHTVLDYYQH